MRYLSGLPIKAYLLDIRSDIIGAIKGQPLINDACKQEDVVEVLQSALRQVEYLLQEIEK